MEPEDFMRDCHNIINNNLTVFKFFKLREKTENANITRHLSFGIPGEGSQDTFSDWIKESEVVYQAKIEA